MRKNILLQRILAVAAVGFLVTSSHAQSSKQNVRVDVDDVQFEDLESPEFGGNTGEKNFRPKSWLEAEVKLKVETGRGFDKKFVESLTVKWKVAVKNPDGGGVFLIEKDVEYINVPVNEDVFASVYLSPGAILRITGSDRAAGGIMEAVAGEVVYNGATVGDFNNKGGEWWTAKSVSKNSSIPLLAKSETPFKFLWWDRYLEEKPPRR